MALAYGKPFAKGERRYVSARLVLPAIASNRGWYATWIMIDGTQPGNSGTAFAQVGLIRRPEIDSSLRVFIAFKKIPDSKPIALPNGSGLQTFTVPLSAPRHIDYEDVAIVSEVKHTVSIEQRGTTFIFRLDGRLLKFPLSINLGTPYVQLGSEVSHPGDLASGNLSDIHVGQGRPRDGVPDYCSYSFGGLGLRSAANGFVSTGTFDPNIHSSLRGRCVPNSVPLSSR